MHAPRIDDRTGPRRSQFSSIPIRAVAARLSPSLLSTRVLLSHRRSSPRSLAMDPARLRSLLASPLPTVASFQQSLINLLSDFFGHVFPWLVSLNGSMFCL
jgi:hypothetical protein